MYCPSRRRRYRHTWRGSWGNTEPFAEIRGQTTTNPPKKSCRTAILRSDQLFLCACISDFALQIDPDPLVPDHGVWKMAVEVLGILACGNKTEQRLHALCLQSHPTWENFPVLRGNSREWDGSRHGSATAYSHSTAAPNMGEFSRSAGKFSRVGRIASRFSCSLFPLHCRTQHGRIFPFCGEIL